MADIVTSQHIGSTIILTLETYDEEDVKTDVDDLPTPQYPAITIKKGKTIFVVINAQAIMITHPATGEYKYYWDTTGYPLGPYNIEIEYSVYGVFRLIKKQFVLTD